jgi:multimeric flavodoxin WrbA
MAAMPTSIPTGLKAFALNCSLRPTASDEPSSTDKMLRDLLAALAPHEVSGAIERAADHDIKPGVLSDMGDGDAWPSIRARILAADIFVLGTPIWLGQPSSVAKRVLERLDAFLSEADDRNRMPAAGKVALVAVVGNEDGAHACHAACFQALVDVGFTVPANAGVYWVGEAMQATNYVDLDVVPDPVASSIALAASNAAHLARLLKAETYPGTGG